ncbi:MAG: S41 family peptidase [Oscillospiraceae bacterium]|nr:S41 family peptidase [Oscillospiraceae bacterium]
MKSKQIKRAAAVFICFILAALLSLQSFALDFENVLQSIQNMQENPANQDSTQNQFSAYASNTTYHSNFDDKYKNYYSAVNTDDIIQQIIDDKSINPQLDELLDLYAQYNLYNLTRDQAENLMIRKFLLDNPNAIPVMGNSLLKAIDQFGGYYSQTSTDELFGNIYKGYGIVFDGKKMEDGNLYNTIVKKVLKGSPALSAGLEPGDEIIGVNGINVENLGVMAVSELLATVEDKVDLKVRRDGKEMTFTMQKSTVYISSITFKTVGDKADTALITIENFTDEGMADDFYLILQYLKQENYKNLILDLRNNTGGDMYSMAEMLDMLTPDKGIPLFSYQYNDGTADTVKSSGQGMKFDKICVLTNGYTASASEIFSLSLKEITGAVLIGEKTYGKGIGQFYTELESSKVSEDQPGDIVAITAFEIISSKGNKYHKIGIEPDIKISPKLTDVKNIKFDQLNFVNCVDIKKGADNKAVLALNQRLARIGFLSPDGITSKCTDNTVTAVEIFQKYNDLPVGIDKIDNMFIDYLNYYVSYTPNQFEQQDTQLECAQTYISQSKEAAENYAKNNS